MSFLADDFVDFWAVFAGMLDLLSEEPMAEPLMVEPLLLVPLWLDDIDELLWGVVPVLPDDIDWVGVLEPLVWA
jgi:hypothetical protein